MSNTDELLISLHSSVKPEEQTLVRHDTVRVKIGEWEVDSIRAEVSRDGECKKVERRLLKLLMLLARHPGKPVTKDVLLTQVWAGKYASNDTLSVAISQLRKLLGCNANTPQYIETISGFGYRLLAPVTPLEEVCAGQGDVGKQTEAGVNAQQNARDKTRQKKVQKRFFLIFLTAASLAVAFFAGLLWIEKNKNLNSDKNENNNAMSAASIDAVLQHSFYQKARFLLEDDKRSHATIQEAKQLAQALIDLFPDSAEAYALVATSNKFLYFYSGPIEKKAFVPEIQQSVDAALNLDPSNLRALTEAWQYYSYINIQPRKAVEYLNKAITLNPSDGAAHAQYAQLMLALRNFDRAVHHNKVAAAILASHYSSASMIWIFQMSGRYDEALEELNRLYSVMPDSLDYHRSAIKLYENMGNEEKAFELYLASFKRVGYSDEQLKQVEIIFQEKGLQGLNEWLVSSKKEEKDVGQHTPPYSFARYHAAAGNAEQAIEYLEKTEQENRSVLLWINTDPKFASLAGLPRFEALKSRLGL